MFMLKDIYLIKIGSTWLTDGLFLFLLTPLAFVSTCLNLISFIVFTKIETSKTNLTKYLRYYTFISFVGCFIGSFSGLTSARYFEFVSTFWISLYQCNFITYMTTIEFYVNVLDCFILLERISYFNETIKLKLSKFKARKLSVIAFLVCNLINLPYIVQFLPRLDYEYQEAMSNFNLTTVDFTYCKRNSYFQSNGSKIALFLIIFLRNFVTTLIQLVLALYSIKYFRDYLKKKRFYLYLYSLNNNNNDFNLEYYKVLYRNEKFNRNITKMTILISLCSILLNFSIIATYLTIMIFFNSITTLEVRQFYLILFFLGYLKYSSNFFFFCKFNKSFRIFSRNILTTITSTNPTITP